MLRVSLLVGHCTMFSAQVLFGCSLCEFFCRFSGVFAFRVHCRVAAGPDSCGTRVCVSVCACVSPYENLLLPSLLLCLTFLFCPAVDVFCHTTRRMEERL